MYMTQQKSRDRYFRLRTERRAQLRTEDLTDRSVSQAVQHQDNTTSTLGKYKSTLKFHCVTVRCNSKTNLSSFGRSVLLHAENVSNKCIYITFTFSASTLTFAYAYGPVSCMCLRKGHVIFLVFFLCFLF